MRRHRGLLVVGLFVCLFIAGVASFYASGSPDGLEKVAADQGFEDTAERHPFGDSPLADYAARGVHNARLSGGLAGVAGVGLTAGLAGGLFLLLGRGRPTPAGEAPADPGSAGVTDPGPDTPADPGPGSGR